jgi:hypothetical protein
MVCLGNVRVDTLHKGDNDYDDYDDDDNNNNNNKSLSQSLKRLSLHPNTYIEM